MDAFLEKLHAYDLGTLYWFGTQRQGHPGLTYFMDSITHLGDREVVGVLAACGALLFVASRRWVAGLIFAVSLIAAMGLTEGGKRLVDRKRPEVSWVEKRKTTPSFPSGHALSAMALFGTAAFMAARRVRGGVLRTVIVLEGLVLAVLVGLSRPFIGDHYPLDVIGGWTAGLACALLAFWADGRWGMHHPPTGPPATSSVPSGAISPPGEAVQPVARF